MPSVFSKPLSPTPKSQDAWLRLLALGEAHPSPRSPEVEAALDDAALFFFENQDFLDKDVPPVRNDYGQRSTTWIEFLQHFPSAFFYKKRMEDFLAWYEAEIAKRKDGRETWVIENYLVLYFDKKRYVRVVMLINLSY